MDGWIGGRGGLNYCRAVWMGWTLGVVSMTKPTLWLTAVSKPKNYMKLDIAHALASLIYMIPTAALRRAKNIC